VANKEFWMGVDWALTKRKKDLRFVISLVDGPKTVEFFTSTSNMPYSTVHGALRRLVVSGICAKRKNIELHRMEYGLSRQEFPDESFSF